MPGIESRLREGMEMAIMDQCPACGDKLECETGAISTWCCSGTCGGCFRDLKLEGAARRLADLERDNNPEKRPA